MCPTFVEGVQRIIIRMAPVFEEQLVTHGVSSGAMVVSYPEWDRLDARHLSRYILVFGVYSWLIGRNWFWTLSDDSFPGVACDKLA